MKKLVIIFLLLLLPLAIAQIENYNNYSSLTTNIQITSNLEKTEGSLSYIIAKLSFYPQEYNEGAWVCSADLQNGQLTFIKKIFPNESYSGWSAILMPKGDGFSRSWSLLYYNKKI